MFLLANKMYRCGWGNCEWVGGVGIIPLGCQVHLTATLGLSLLQNTQEYKSPISVSTDRYNTDTVTFYGGQFLRLMFEIDTGAVSL